MRVISGKYKGRRLKSLEGSNTRPTTDKVKESIFNMIGPYFDGGEVLDLFAGSGGLAIEAISRGMDHAVLVEKNGRALQVIKENVQLVRDVDQFEVRRGDADRVLADLAAEGRQFDLIFLDPPYAQQKITQQITKMIAEGLLTDTAWIVCETDKQVLLPENIEGWRQYRRQEYGITAITLFEKEETQ
ncbi:rRNA methyltransferase [Enterococcus canis]|uniref:rRNA methyltransferase n=1 Tax=Enterococcus canis TaxID=214095 RepID=A0A1L8RJL9_9ENTE|nr:16S rRNA (guanine(966)-N(2))-methyltransferase RsmD [Enterococcus canis]OJG19959.1 rRNA methyltransferase [Enterococcus canis]